VLTGNLFGKANSFILDDELKKVSFLLELNFKFFLQFLNSAYEVVNLLWHFILFPIRDHLACN